MYKIKLLEEDKWNIHSSSYNSSKYGSNFLDGKKDDKKYHEQKYGSKEKEEKHSQIFDELEEENGRKEIKEDEIPSKAAKQVFNESRNEIKKTEIKKDVKTIEDAIKKAIEDEKKVIIMDN